MKNSRFGFVAPQHDKKDYVFGGLYSLPKVIFQPDGNWSSYLPLYERQYGSGWDSYGCTVFGTLNCLETIMKRRFEKDFDFSERYIYNIVGIEPPGADPKKVAQAMHENGVLDQDVLPFIDNLMSFRSPRPMTKEYLDKGHKWLEKLGFGYEWVYEGKVDKSKLRECLRYSPIGISWTPGYRNEKGQYYSPIGQPNTHWSCLYAIGQDGEYFVFDSYDQEIKILTADHNIQYAMRYHIETIGELTTKKNILESIVEILKTILGLKKKL